MASESAGLDGLDWDRTRPGAHVVDAIHRRVLLRFPGAADAIVEKLAGRVIAHVELGLDFDGTDNGAAAGYTTRDGLGNPKWKADPPEWHLAAWGIYRPWRSDPLLGPTFNASIAKAQYWARFGADAAGVDRSPEVVSSAELSSRSTHARLDLTGLLRDERYGATLGARLRSLEEQGVLLRKVETYDIRYKDSGDAYEWAVPTGGHGIQFKNAELVVDLAPGSSPPVELPPARDVRELAKTPVGKPTTTFPTDEEFAAIANKVMPGKPAWMPAWQWERVVELFIIGGGRGSDWANAFLEKNNAGYRKLMMQTLATPYRYWRGWELQSDLLNWYMFRDAMPPYVQEHVKEYWRAWLMPETPFEALVHPQSPESRSFWKSSADWRGRSSFFRGGYLYVTSTMNFNHMAAVGALLGGALIDSERVVEEGRHGLRNFPLKLWSFSDGSTQESIDPYYLSITLGTQKMFADFGPRPEDRLVGRILVDRTLEMLTSAYHPELGRLISSAGRSTIGSLLVTDQGLTSVLHTLSPKGTLRFVHAPLMGKVEGFRIFGDDFPPGRVALETIPSPWGDDWVGNAIDRKALPYDLTATTTTRGTFRPPLWERIHLGRHFGIASQDLRTGVYPFVAQWTRTKAPSRSPLDLGTMTARYAVNTPDLVTTSGGSMLPQGGLATFQYGNRAILCMKPRSEKARLVEIAGKDGVQSLASVLALFDLEHAPSWEIWVDQARVKTFPFKARASQRITIRDGATFLGITPLPAKNLGRKDEIVIGFGGGGNVEGEKREFKPALLISSFNLQREAGSNDTLDWKAITEETHGGFIVELADTEDYPSFAAFRAHIASAKLGAKFDNVEKVLHVSYTSGATQLEMGCSTSYRQEDAHRPVPPGEQVKAMPYRRVNGAWPYLPPGIDRESSMVQQGTTGTLERGSAKLVLAPGRTGYLEVEPISGAVLAIHPEEERAPFRLKVGGAIVASEGDVGLARVVLRAADSQVSIAASSGDVFLLSGLGPSPTVTVNGTPAKLEARDVNGQPAFLVRTP